MSRALIDTQVNIVARSVTDAGKLMERAAVWWAEQPEDYVADIEATVKLLGVQEAAQRLALSPTRDDRQRLKSAKRARSALIRVLVLAPLKSYRASDLREYQDLSTVAESAARALYMATVTATNGAGWLPAFETLRKEAHRLLESVDVLYRVACLAESRKG